MPCSPDSRTAWSAPTPPDSAAFCVERLVPGAAVRLHVSGRIDRRSVPALRAAIDRARRQSVGSLLVVRLAAVHELDAVAVPALADADRAHRASGGRVVLQGVTDAAEAALRLADPDRTLEIIDPDTSGHPEPTLPLDPVPATVVALRGTVSGWTVAALRHAVLTAHRAGPGTVAVDLSAAVVATGAPTVSLCATLRRLGERDVPLHVLGAPPAVALTLAICAPEVLAPA